jgi:GNAT superfamily N-acetyltransferase
METKNIDISVRLLIERDLPVADRIFRLAFGTFLGYPEPLTYGGDNDSIRARWLATPNGALGAEVNGELVASNFVINWGSVGFFGPLTVHPDLWDRGIAIRILESTMELFNSWEIKHIGIFTFAQSMKHIGLYQKFGFWPRFLTAIMSKPVKPIDKALHWSRYSEMPDSERGVCLNMCYELTHDIFDGLDLTREIQTVYTHGFGETVLIWDKDRLVGFAICHCGSSTEAGSGNCYIKFGAVQLGPKAGHLFEQLLDACEFLAAEQGMTRLLAGVNTARHEAYRTMIVRGFSTDVLGVAMQKPNKPGYNRHNVYIIDDWR